MKGDYQSHWLAFMSLLYSFDPEPLSLKKELLLLSGEYLDAGGRLPIVSARVLV